MGRKIRLKTVQYFQFYCPGCKCEHTVSDVGGWEVTGSTNYPTITPSVHCDPKMAVWTAVVRFIKQNKLTP